MRQLDVKQVMANQSMLCPFCGDVTDAGELFWQMSGSSNTDPIAICRKHIPLNTKDLIVEPASDSSPFTQVRPDAFDIRRQVIPTLLTNWDSIYDLTPEEFEELVFDRLLAMDLQPFRLGPANRKDGGIDIIFWTKSTLPILGAVQVKHHRSPNTKTGSEEVQKLMGAMQGYHFNVGLVVTNTSYTRDAEYQAAKESSIVQLRDGLALKKWIADDFAVEKVNVVTRAIEFCPG